MSFTGMHIPSGTEAHRRAACAGLAEFRCGQPHPLTGQTIPTPPRIYRKPLPPLEPTGVITQAMAEAVDASIAAQRREHRRYQLTLLLTTGEVLP
jgi:hypothetical protein